MLATTSILALSANRAEISTGNLRADSGKFDNLKASWEKSLNLGDWKTTVKANYDYNANKEFLKEVSLSGGLVEAVSADDVAVDYEVTRDFSSRQTDVKLTGERKRSLRASSRGGCSACPCVRARARLRRLAFTRQPPPS